MVTALQVGGAILIAAALLQAFVAMAAQIEGAFRRRKLDQRRIAAFEAETNNLFKRAMVERERAESTWAGKRKFRIIKRQFENNARDICSFYLQPHDGGALPPFLPGQFLTFELSIPGHPMPVVRCYSLSESPLVRHTYRVSIRRLPPPPKAPPDVPGGLSSNFFHGSLMEGDVVDVMAPNGGFHLDTDSHRPVVLIAGGIGLTPVLSMLKYLADAGGEREAWFFYAARNSSDIALANELRAIVEKNSKRFHLVIAYNAPTEQCILGRDYDHHGFVSVDLMKSRLPSSNYEFYVCGPPPMMEMIVAQLRDWGVPEADIHFEAFGPATVKTVNKTVKKPEAAESGKLVTVEFAKSRKRCDWTKAAGTLLELADANGIRINSGCRAGNCNTCLTAVKAGTVTYLTPPARIPAQGSALVCIAYPDSEVVLDA